MDFQTPDWCCQYMARLVPSSAIKVLEPTPGEGNLVRALQAKGYQVTAPVDFWDMGSPGYFDCIVMNPPFSPMVLGYKILEQCLCMSHHVIALMPWLTMINSERRTKELMSYGLISIAHLPRKTFPGARVQCCIMELSKGYSGKTEFKAV